MCSYLCFLVAFIYNIRFSVSSCTLISRHFAISGFYIYRGSENLNTVQTLVNLLLIIVCKYVFYNIECLENFFPEYSSLRFFFKYVNFLLSMLFITTR